MKPRVPVFMPRSLVSLPMRNFAQRRIVPSPPIARTMSAVSADSFISSNCTNLLSAKSSRNLLLTVSSTPASLSTSQTSRAHASAFFFWKFGYNAAFIKAPLKAF